MDDSSHEQFLGHLRQALNNLYYPDLLRRSPLAEHFGLERQPGAAAALQKILLEAIESLHPGPHEPGQTHAWRIYDTLVFRYVRQFDRDVVAGQLGISGRQLRREQRSALEALAEKLLQSPLLRSAPQEAAAGTAPLEEGRAALVETAAGMVPTGAAAGLSPGEPGLRSELEQLKSLPHGSPDTARTVESALALTAALARQHNTALLAPPIPALPALSIPELALKHALLTMLNGSIPACSSGKVSLRVKAEGPLVRFELAGRREGMNPAAALAAVEKALKNVRELALEYGGALDCSSEPSSFQVTLSLPTAEQVPVLVIDDNSDTLDLFRRYCTGTRYKIVGLREPARAAETVLALQPRLILLDLMMPDVDGWDVLSQLHGLSGLSETPIAMFSILPQGALAMALGADAFLQKPVSRQELIDTLDRLNPG